MFRTRTAAPRVSRLASVAILALATAAALVLPQSSVAAVYSNGSNSATFDVTMKIVANCIISAGGMDFGQSQGVLSTAVTASSALSVTCTNTTPYNLGLSAGSGTGSSGTTRYLSGTGGNTGTVAFNLYQTAGGTAWGDTQGSNTLGAVGTGVLRTHTVYGEVPAQATPAPDTYKSTITATVYF
jgi:spore coat protein U-like protein